MQSNVGVTMSDGTVLRADVYYPTNLKGGGAAAGKFPVILTQTPYGKGSGGAAGSQLSGLAGSATYLVQRGYIQVVADVRGTGGSRGAWGLFDPVQASDGATLARWAAQLPHSDGDVGLLGASYLGIDQFLTVGAAGPNSPIKAMFPIITGNDLYRDTAFFGGFLDGEFDSVYLGLTGSLNTINPVLEDNSDLLQTLTEHLGGLLSYHLAQTLEIEAGGDQAYDQDYWQSRSPVNTLQKVVADGIPAFLVGGWYDLFQRGEPLNYSGLQNAWAGRPVLAPMSPTQPVTPRYQVLMGPYYHVTAGNGLDYHGLDLSGLELAWFDQWLKGIDTGIADTSTPMHLYDLGAGGALTTSQPAASGGADTIYFSLVSSPCDNSSEQWAAGFGVLALRTIGLDDPCVRNQANAESGPWSTSYTTAPFTSPTTLAGPIGATLYATATTPDTAWVVTLSDIAPDGTAAPLTSGGLEGSLRAVDPSHSWYAPDGLPLLPYHPYTRVSQTPVVPGQMTRYDIEVFPTFGTLEPGHRLRVTIATADFPHLLLSLAQLTNLLGGSYQLQHNSVDPSSIELPLAPASAFGAAPPTPASGTATSGASPAACVSGNPILIRLRGRGRLTGARASMSGRSLRTRRTGRNGVLVTLRKLPRGSFTLIVHGHFAGGRRVTVSRRLRYCGGRTHHTARKGRRAQR
jgi:putative CocE/NonD family hydrolase